MESRASLPSYRHRLVEVVTLLLMLGVTAQLATTALIDPITILIVLVSLVLVAAGALIGIIHTLSSSMLLRGA